MSNNNLSATPCCCSLAGTKACDTCTNNPNRWSDASTTTTTAISYDLGGLEPKKLFRCPKCNTEIKEYQKYCHECGQKIRWGGISYLYNGLTINADSGISNTITLNNSSTSAIAEVKDE